MTSLPDLSGVARNGVSVTHARMLTVALVADALDGLGLREQVMDGGIAPLAPGSRLVGWARPIDVQPTDIVPDEPYVGEMAAIASLRPGDIPVYRVADTVKAALFGELFSVAAGAQGSVGAVVDGAVRDVRQIRALGFPVFARGVSPYDTRGRAEVVSHDVPVTCGSVVVAAGDLIVADDDGVVVTPAVKVAEVIDAVAARVSAENGALAALVSGATVHEVWERWRVF